MTQTLEQTQLMSLLAAVGQIIDIASEELIGSMSR
jgi:hypothetical protein